MTTVTQGIEVVNEVHKLKAKPAGWWLTAVGIVSFALVVWGGPKVRALGERMTKLDERTERIEKSVTRIETALINRGAMAARTDVDHDVAQRVADEGMVPPFRLDFLGSAEASDVAGRGPLRSGVRGPADRAVPGAGGRVGKVTQ